jgi:hypothetical protein
MTIVSLWQAFQGLKVLSDENQSGSKVVSIASFFLYCSAADIFNFDLKGQYSLKSIKPVSAFNDKKISFVESM